MGVWVDIGPPGDLPMIGNLRMWLETETKEKMRGKNKNEGETILYLGGGSEAGGGKLATRQENSAKISDCVQSNTSTTYGIMKIESNRNHAIHQNTNTQLDTTFRNSATNDEKDRPSISRDSINC